MRYMSLGGQDHCLKRPCGPVRHNNDQRRDRQQELCSGPANPCAARVGPTAISSSHTILAPICSDKVLSTEHNSLLSLKLITRILQQENSCALIEVAPLSGVHPLHLQAAAWPVNAFESARARFGRKSDAHIWQCGCALLHPTDAPLFSKI